MLVLPRLGVSQVPGKKERQRIDGIFLKFWNNLMIDYFILEKIPGVQRSINCLLNWQWYLVWPILSFCRSSESVCTCILLFHFLSTNVTIILTSLVYQQKWLKLRTLTKWVYNYFWCISSFSINPIIILLTRYDRNDKDESNIKLFLIHSAKNETQTE